MSHTANFSASNNLALPGSGLASRRGGQAIKPLSIDAIKPAAENDGALPTPRTSRSHLLAGLRTAPKSATTATFPPSPTTASAMNQQSRNAPAAGTSYSSSETNSYSGPKTSLPRFAHGQTYNSAYAQQQAQQQQAAVQQAQQQRILQAQQQQLLQQQQQAQAQAQAQHYTADQILAPPELDDDAAVMDAEYAEMMATNMYLAQQQQRLQQQLMSVQAAQQQFQNLNISGGNSQQQQQQVAAYQQLLFQQQQQVLAAQQQAAQQQQQLYAYIDPATGQQALYVGQASGINSQYVDQYNANLQQLQYLQLLQKQQQLQLQQQQAQQAQQAQQQQLLQEQDQRMPHQHHSQQTRGSMFQQQFQQQHMHRQASPITAPRVQVSPPPSEGANGHSHRNMSPPRRIDSTTPSSDHAPLPPPSANAFRRGHKKSASLFNGANLLDVNGGAGAANSEVPKSAGPKTATFPPNVMQAGTYGPGQARAGEHPIRQPRGPPNFDELASKPTSKHEGSKNFATRTRRSAVHNLVRAGFSRRQVTASGSSGSISPISETAGEATLALQTLQIEDDLATPLSDDESGSVSGRSGSGSLNGDDVECSLPSSRTSTGSWGAIGSERPGSREKSITRKSVESLNSTGTAATGSDSESVAGGVIPGSFASVFKSKPIGGQQRKAPMVLMKNTEKRRFAA